MSNERCQNCRYWSADESEGMIGDCRRYPPMVPPVGMGLNPWKTFFPDTGANRWCGEWQAKRAPKAKGTHCVACGEPARGYTLDGVPMCRGCIREAKVK